MDWIDVARTIAPIAPFAGSVIGGLIPIPGSSAAGQMLGTFIAKQFGVPATPDAVHAAVTTNPNEVVLAKITAGMEEAKAQWPALAEVEKAWAATVGIAITQVNATMRGELGHEHWFFTGWRPTAGWEFDIFAAVFGVLLSIAGVKSVLFDSHGAIDAIGRVWQPFAAFLAILAAMVGVYVVARSQDKGKMIEAGALPATAAPTSPPPPQPKLGAQTVADLKAKIIPAARPASVFDRQAPAG